MHDGTTVGDVPLAKQSEIPDLSSITPLNVPDYTNGYDVSRSSFTATELCFVSCDTRNSTVRINGKHIGYGANTVNIQVFLSQGDTISGYSSPLHVFPLKFA